KLQERYDKKLKERKEHGIWNTNHAYWGEILEDAIKLQALKDIRDNGLLLTKEEINSYEDEIKAESERKEKESKRINTVIDYYEEESETNPNLDKKELVKIYDAIENGKDTSKFNQHDVEGMAAFMGVDLKKVKKSFDDQFLLDMAVEDEIQKVEEEQEEESLFDDYSAEQPELFNSTAMKVQEAFNRCKVL
ncbi:MAG: hypothetical protein J6T31_06205, partial [Methanobrevibacter sp.]|nr:hypothetical protein [Methanobrevibacter sp.]